MDHHSINELLKSHEWHNAVPMLFRRKPIDDTEPVSFVVELTKVHGFKPYNTAWMCDRMIFDDSRWEVSVPDVDITQSSWTFYMGTSEENHREALNFMKLLWSFCWF